MADNKKTKNTKTELQYQEEQRIALLLSLASVQILLKTKNFLIPIEDSKKQKMRF